MIYEIAGIKVKMNPQYDKLIRQSKEYLSEGDYDIDIDVPEEITAAFMADYPYLSAEDCEYILYGTNFYNQILPYGAFLLHSSAVVKNGKAYLFSAPSGTGKSTHTSLWVEEFYDAYILNDDKPAIRMTDKGIYAYGTPFSGKTDLNVNKGVPLKGICILERGEKNRIEKAQAEFAVYSVLDQTIRPSDESRMDMLLELLDRVAENIGIYRMQCNMDKEAAHTAYNAMVKDR